MSTLRSSILLDHKASDVWAIIRDTSRVSRWFPGITESTGDEKQRRVVLGDGSAIIEDIVTLDDELRRMQYAAVGGDLPIERHLGTVDVLVIDDERSLVVYSTEITPDALAPAFHSAIDEAVRNLPTYLG